MDREEDPALPRRRISGRPSYMTVGTGSTSESAKQLASMLDEDSGYGGSLSTTSDKYTPSGSPTGENSEQRRVLASHVHQLYYNKNKTALGRAIQKTLDALQRLQDMNATWPAHYPSVQPPTYAQATRPGSSGRPGLDSTQSSRNVHPETEGPFARPGPPRRAGTSLGEGSSQGAESSIEAARRPAPEPRLVTPQLAQDFSILKIDLKLGSLSQSEIVHTMEKKSIATLLDNQIQLSVRHLQSLRERIEDNRSKVLVTGDLNAGKSTFCNALLRRKILPEDQQPCTSIFCEVLNAGENGGVEEVHAIPIGANYDRNDERTYEVHPLKNLENIVINSDRYSQCKIYVKDIRSVDESLLNNSVVDIALIDAPGLNNDSLKTTAVFARQEEIDVVVFVVSAANHFTQSAKEFIFNAAREKAYIFMVVNGFDTIRDKKRCEEMIMKQVGHLSPATAKESAELVHFVSSNAIPVAGPGVPVGGGSGSGGSSSGPGFEDPDGDGDDDDPSRKHGEPGAAPDKGKGKEKEKIRDFEELEASLRRFVLEKRARSKLAPAKTYLMNVLGDLNSLGTVNREMAVSELNRVTKELEDLEPLLNKSKVANAEASQGTDRTIEDKADEAYEYTRSTLNDTIARIAEADLGVDYPGLFSAYQYADDIKEAMLEQISGTVKTCEGHARESTVQGVNTIQKLAHVHLGDDYQELSFRSDLMFRKKKDDLARQVDIDVEISDFFDIASLWERQEKAAGTSVAVTVVGVLGGRMMGGPGWVDSALGVVKVMGSQNLRRMIIPGLLAAVVIGVSYTLSQIPASLPKRLSSKLSIQLQQIDYTRLNATRISNEVRRALKYPADNLRVGLRHSFEKLQSRRDETSKRRSESEVATKYFGNLVREAGEVRNAVEGVDLERHM